MGAQLSGAVVVVAGADGAFGHEFVEQALGRGAKRVYVLSTAPRPWADARVVSLTSAAHGTASVVETAMRTADATIVIDNTAGSGSWHGPTVAEVFGPLVARNGGGSIVDVALAARPAVGGAAIVRDEPPAGSEVRTVLHAADVRLVRLVLAGAVPTPGAAVDPRSLVSRAYDELQGDRLDAPRPERPAVRRVSIADSYPELGEAFRTLEGRG